MKARKFNNKIIFILSILFLLILTNVYSQSSSEVELTLTSYFIEEEQTLSIPLHIQSKDQISALQLLLSFDPSVIDINEVVLINEKKENTVLQVVKQGTGKIAILLISTVDLPTNASLLHLNCTATGPKGKGTFLIIGKAEALKSKTGEKVPVKTVNGYLLITAPPFADILYPIGFGLALFGAFVLAIVGIKLLSSKKKVRSMCPSCGTLLDKKLSYCPNCNQVFRKKCNNCGAIVPITNINCPFCHQALKNITYAHKPQVLAKLIITSESSEEKEYLLKEQIINMGRSHKNNIVFGDDLQVSGHHAQIVRQGGQFILIDLKSTNGTFVNQKKITQHILKDGDEISVGNTQIAFYQ